MNRREMLASACAGLMAPKVTAPPSQKMTVSTWQLDFDQRYLGLAQMKDNRRKIPATNSEFRRYT